MPLIQVHARSLEAREARVEGAADRCRAAPWPGKELGGDGHLLALGDPSKNPLGKAPPVDLCGIEEGDASCNAGGEGLRDFRFAKFLPVVPEATIAPGPHANPQGSDFYGGLSQSNPRHQTQPSTWLG